MHVTVAQRQVAAIDVDVVRGRGERRVGIAVGVELAKLHGGYAVLRAARKAVVVQVEHAVLEVEVGRGVVVAYARGIERSRAAVTEDHAGNPVVARAAELPATAPAISRRVAAWRVFDQSVPEIPHRRICRVESAYDDWIRDTRLLGKVHAKRVGAGRNDHLVARVSRLDLGITIVRGDVNDRCFRNVATQPHSDGKHSFPANATTSALHTQIFSTRCAARQKYFRTKSVPRALHQMNRMVAQFVGCWKQCT